MTSVYSQIGTRNKAASPGQQKHSGSLEIFRRTKTSEQSTSHPRLLNLRFRRQEGIRHRCSDVLR